MKPNVIKQVFASTMKTAQFQKKADGWYRETSDAVLVANLQKSDFGEQYHVNLAVWLKALGEVAFPKEYQCHVRVRAAALDPDRQRYWDSEVFNLENRDILDAGRAQLVEALLTEIAIPFLLSAGSLADLRQLHRAGRLEGAAVMRRALEVLQG